MQTNRVVKKAIKGVWRLESWTPADGQALRPPETDGLVLYADGYFMESKRFAADGAERMWWRRGTWKVVNGLFVWRLDLALATDFPPSPRTTEMQRDREKRGKITVRGGGIDIDMSGALWRAEGDTFTVQSKTGEVSVWKRVERL